MYNVPHKYTDTLKLWKQPQAVLVIKPEDSNLGLCFLFCFEILCVYIII